MKVSDSYLKHNDLIPNRMIDYVDPSKINILLIIAAIAFIFIGCAKKTEIARQSASGTYSGQTADGKPVTLTIEDVKHGFFGQGEIDGEPAVISGIRVWSATGTMTKSDGSSTLVNLYLEPGSENLVLQTPGGSKTVLKSGAVPVTLVSGPFSGKYKVKGESKGLASAKISQFGSLIVGTAKISDRFSSITGNVVEPNRAQGTITYIDESQVLFEALLSSDGQTVTLTGLGEPIILEKF